MKKNNKLQYFNFKKFNKEFGILFQKANLIRFIKTKKKLIEK